MNMLFILALTSLAIKHLVDSLKPIYSKEQGWNVSLILSTVFGLAIAFSIVGADFLALVGFETTNSIVGQVITGLGLAGGSNTIFDLVKDKLAPTTEVRVDEVRTVEIKED